MTKRIRRSILCFMLVAIMAIGFSLPNVVEAVAISEHVKTISIDSELEVAASCNHIYSPHVEKDVKHVYKDNVLQYTQITEYIYNRCVKCGYQQLVDARTYNVYP